VKVFIPAAGFGKRMGNLTAKIPKPMLTISGIPLIHIALYYAWKWGATDAIINTHHFGEKIIHNLRNFPHFKIHFSEEKSEILGTAGGMKTGISRFWKDTEYFLSINPDLILFPNENFIPMPKNFSGKALLYLHNRNENDEYTSLSLADGKVKFSSGDRPADYFYIGAGIFNTSIFDRISPERYSDLSDIFGELEKSSLLEGRLFSGSVLDVGDLDRYEKMKNFDIFSKINEKSFREFQKGWV